MALGMPSISFRRRPTSLTSRNLSLCWVEAQSISVAVGLAPKRQSIYSKAKKVYLPLHSTTWTSSTDPGPLQLYMNRQIQRAGQDGRRILYLAHTNLH